MTSTVLQLPCCSATHIEEVSHCCACFSNGLGLWHLRSLLELEVNLNVCMVARLWRWLPKLYHYKKFSLWFWHICHFCAAERKLLRKCLTESGKYARIREEVATVENIRALLTLGCRALHYSGHGFKNCLVSEGVFFNFSSVIEWIYVSIAGFWRRTCELLPICAQYLSSFVLFCYAPDLLQGEMHALKDEDLCKLVKAGASLPEFVFVSACFSVGVLCWEPL